MAGKIDVFEKAVQLGVQGDTDGLSDLLTEDLAGENVHVKKISFMLDCKSDAAQT